MTSRLVLALIAFLCWLAISITGGNISAGGEAESLGAGVQRGIGRTWVAAG